MRATHKKLAFSLLELSIVVAVISIMVGGMLNIAAQNIREKKQAELQMKMDAIEQALIGFRKANNRLPCPADGTYPIDSTNFGIEGGAAGACNTGASYTSGNRTSNPTPPTANFYYTLFGIKVVGGVVPTRTLGLPDEYAFDPWGGRFTYAIDPRISATSAFTTYGPTSSSIGTIAVRAAVSGTSISTAVAVVISHGQNGHGAFQLSGVRKNAGVTNDDEKQNCHCNASGVATTFDNIFIQATPTSTGLGVYDDITRYYTRSNFLSASDRLTEK